MRLKSLLISRSVALLYFALLCRSAFAQPGRSFEEYKAQIIQFGKEEKYDRVLLLLGEVKRKFPEEKEFQARIYYHTAFGLYKKGEINRVRSFLEKASEEYPFDDAIWALYARALIRLGEKKAAMNILKRYPNDPDTFIQDVNKSNLNIWTTYNLAASYALLGNDSLSLLYLSTLFSAKGFDPKISFSHVEEDGDFTSLRDDGRYVFLANTAFAENFDDALRKLQKVLEDSREVVNKFHLGEVSVDETTNLLQQFTENTKDINTVAPILIRIRREIINGLEKTRQEILKGQYSEKTRDNFEKRFRRIEKHLQLARKYQQAHQN